MGKAQFPLLVLQKSKCVWDMIPTEPVYIVDIIRNIVNAVDTALYSDGTLEPAFPHVYYLHGHPLDIVARLQEKLSSPNDKDKRFPLIALIQDIREERMPNAAAYADAPLNIMIAALTEAKWNSEQRYDKTFKPVLYPIYYEFLNQVELSTEVSTINHSFIKHNKYDRLYWGKQGLYGNTGNMFNDFIDAIEIDNLRLQIMNKPNCVPSKNI